MRQSLLVKKHMFGSYTKKDVGTSSQLVTASENNMNPNLRFNNNLQPVTMVHKMCTLCRAAKQCTTYYRAALL